ncbi:tail fiber assembly protein [Xenorhabdus ehlersii]|uniref:Tail assembly chaperone n=1 Tax=Xenorhabdus ehlersii TaxID=290111 RepID=A0A2D0IW15_9GAMM|nr:tail fiber assembly protein [Xenorhabdus ehlersii]PHM26090.1 tail assembly chaperone [Xenorhabdus ehlersii]RKE88658.1 virus tail fiber assembly protein lambda gpK [Xenorhabdus ehlersii]
MVKFESFQKYKPTDAIAGVAYLMSADNTDWYECQKLFSPATLKIVYDENLVIRSMGYDVSAFFPIGLSIAEIDPKQVPVGLNINGGWQYRAGKICPRIYTPEEYQQQAVYQKQHLMNIARDKIAPLQDAVDLDMATDAEKLSLAEWRKYRVLLNRVDCSTAPDIQWPEQPK